MNWIHKIKIANYRAFSKQESITIPEGHNVLIYGENGSGKRTIYASVRDFFSASAESAFSFALNTFEQDRGNANGGIHLHIPSNEADRNADDIYTFGLPNTNNNHQKSFLQIANKLKGFLDYKRMLRIHALEVPENHRPNFFNLVIKELLKEYQIPNPSSPQSEVEIWIEYIRITDILCHRNKRGRSDSKEYEIAERELVLWQNSVQAKLDKIKDKANEFLSKFFKNKIEISFELAVSTIKPYGFTKKEMQESLLLNISYVGKQIPNYHTFLNEARLSAIAISIFLAALKNYPLSAANLRVLYLDDVFIGLDTSNRIPLLQILESEFIAPKDATETLIQDEVFQVFISTYDRNWYELASRWFENAKCKFKHIEMYIGSNSNNPNEPDIPVIIDKDLGYFLKGKAYFAAKDYPAAANYLRKACESEIKRILPQHLCLLEKKDNGEVKEIHELSKLYGNFILYATQNNLDLNAFNQFNTFTKIVYNSLSHDDLEAPHYRSEIEEGIKIVEAFKSIQVKQIFSVNDSPMTVTLWTKDDTTKTKHHYEIQMIENLFIIQQYTNDIQFSKARCRLTTPSHTKDFESIVDALKEILIERGYSYPTDYQQLLDNIKVSNRKKLSDIMTFGNT